MPILVSFFIAAVSGLLAALVAPLVTSSLSAKSWKRQTRFALKYEAFQQSLGALASWCSNALDAELQNTKTSHEGALPVVQLAPTTAQALEHSRALIRALFPKHVADAFELAVRSHISIQNVPNVEFEERRAHYVTVAARDLGLDGSNRLLPQDAKRYKQTLIVIGGICMVIALARIIQGLLIEGDFWLGDPLFLFPSMSAVACLSGTIWLDHFRKD